MCRLTHVTNSILRRAQEENVTISQMKLQKLLYFLYKEYLQRTDKPLFSERFEPWTYGPVVSDVYWAYKDRKAQDIRRILMPDTDGKTRMVDRKANYDFANVFDDVWNRYKDYTGIQLSELSHCLDGAWRKAVFQNEPFLSDSDIKKEGIHL